MKCPRCETSALDEKDREGVVVDVCRQCRGIWLDRGELEKLITRSAAESDHDRDDRDGDDRRSGDDRGERRPRRKRSWLEGIGDIFD